MKSIDEINLIKIQNLIESVKQMLSEEDPCDDIDCEIDVNANLPDQDQYTSSTSKQVEIIKGISVLLNLIKDGTFSAEVFYNIFNTDLEHELRDKVTIEELGLHDVDRNKFRILSPVKVLSPIEDAVGKTTQSMIDFCFTILVG